MCPILVVLKGARYKTMTGSLYLESSLAAESNSGVAELVQQVQLVPDQTYGIHSVGCITYFQACQKGDAELKFTIATLLTRTLTCT